MKLSKLSFALILIASVLVLSEGSPRASGNQSSDPAKSSPASPSARDHQKSESKEKSAPSQQGPPQPAESLIVVTQPQPQAKQATPDTDSKQSYYKWLGPPTWSNWALVAVAIIAAYIAIRTLKVIERQTDAAKISAQAALATANSVVASERAYVPMSHASPGIRINSERGFFEITVKVENCGRTPASVTNVELDVSLRAYEDLLPQEFQCRPTEHHPNGFLVPGGYFFYQRTFPLRGNDLSDTTSGMRKLWVFGYVDYIDTFKTRHRASYVRTYNPHVDDGTQNNLFYPVERPYNYDRPRQTGEGQDWQDQT